jgi:hypothetical protein
LKIVDQANQLLRACSGLNLQRIANVSPAKRQVNAAITRP